MRRKRPNLNQLKSCLSESSNSSTLDLNPNTANHYSNNSGSTPEILRYITAEEKSSSLRISRCISEPDNTSLPDNTPLNEVVDLTAHVDTTISNHVDTTISNHGDSTLENPHFEITVESEETDVTDLIEQEILEDAEAISRFQQLKLLLTSKYLANEPEVWSFVAGWIVKYLFGVAFHEYMDFIPAAVLGISVGSIFAFAIHGAIKDGIAFVRNPPREITSQNNEINPNTDIEQQGIQLSTLSP